MDVVDGQQRLTTLMLAYRAVFSVAAEFKLKLDGDWQSLLLLDNDPSEPTSNRLRLIPAEEDRDIFAAVVRGDERVDKDHLVVKAFNALKRAMAAEFVNDNALDVNSRQKNLNHLAKAIRSRFVFIQIIIDSKERAYEIFHSLNARGTPLAESAKIKNWVFMQLADSKSEEELQVVNRELWNRMVASIEADPGSAKNLAKTLDRFFTTYLWIAHSNATGDRYVYSEFEGYVKNQSENTAVAVENVMRELRDEYSPAFAAMERPADFLTGSHEKSAIEAFERLRTFGVGRDADFLLIELFRQYALSTRSVDDRDHLVHLLMVILSFWLWRTLCGEKNKQFNRLSSTVAKELRDACAPFCKVAGLVSDYFLSLKNHDAWPVLKELEHKLSTNEMDGTNGLLAKRVLNCIECGKIDAEIPAGVQLEHIFPQTPDDAWIKQLGEIEFRRIADQKSSLANLTLLEGNLQAPAGNSIIEKKVVEYAKSQFSTTLDLCNSKTWTSDDVATRGRRLAKKIASLFIRPEPTKELNSHEDEMGKG